jgi:hypothetical protein
VIEVHDVSFTYARSPVPAASGLSFTFLDLEASYRVVVSAARPADRGNSGTYRGGWSSWSSATVHREPAFDRC